MWCDVGVVWRREREREKVNCCLTTLHHISLSHHHQHHLHHHHQSISLFFFRKLLSKLIQSMHRCKKSVSRLRVTQSRANSKIETRDGSTRHDKKTFDVIIKHTGESTRSVHTRFILKGSTSFSSGVKEEVSRSVQGETFETR